MKEEKFSKAHDKENYMRWKNEFKYVAIEEDLRYNDYEIEKVEWVGISFYDGMPSV